jgi:transposase
LADFKRALYGAKSEKGHPDQYHLALEDIETAMAVVHAEDEAIDPPKTAGSKSRVGRGVLPKHLPRIEEIIAPDLTCGCGAERHIIGEDVSERLDIVPAQFRVLVTRRPKYGLVTVTFRYPNSFMRPFAQMPRGFCRLATSGGDADYRSRVWMPLSMQEVFQIA